VPQVWHCKRFFTPLMGSTGIMKKSVMKLMPRFCMKLPMVPQWLQRICEGSGCEPHVKKCVPIMKKKESMGYVFFS
jgi:hypothetical protein